MLVIDENKMKLLKMTEKLLEVAIENRSDILSKYKEIATEIDHSSFLELVNKIKDTDYHNHSLEEKLIALSNLEKEYNELHELECGFKNTYETYSEDKLELSDLSEILIEKISAKINAIQGYLLGIKTVDEKKKQLDDLNSQLVFEEKKRLQTQEKFRDLESKLQENFINAEGRIYDSHANLVYTSIALEYKNIGYDIKELLTSAENIQKEIEKMNITMSSSEEKLTVARICFETNSSQQNKEVYNSILKENAQSKYKLLLLNIAKLINKEFRDYSLLKQKRNDLLKLIEERTKCLNILDVRLSIDPFDRIKINEQLEVIESIGNNEEKINSIRKDIVSLNALLESKIEENRQYSLIATTDDEFIKEPKENNDLNIDEKTSVQDTSDTLDELFANKVVAVNEIDDNFLLSRALEKTHEVVKRVYEMFCVDDSLKEEIVSPELVISEEKNDSNSISQNDSDNLNNEVIDEPNIGETSIYDDIFNQNTPSYDVPIDIQDTSNDDLFTIEDTNEIFNDNQPKNSTISLESNDNLFEDVAEPFESISLFSEKKEDNEDLTTSTEEKNNTSDFDLDDVPISNNSKDAVEEPAMPDIFWTVQDNSDKVSDDVPSFDEQIDALIGEPKTLKKVA